MSEALPYRAFQVIAMALFGVGLCSLWIEGDLLKALALSAASIASAVQALSWRIPPIGGHK